MATISKRGAWARVLVVLATVVLVLAVLAGYARRALVDSDQFANRATAALRSAPVRALIADRITDDVVLARNGDLLAARPLVASVAEGVVGGRAFTSLFRAAVRDVHAAVFAHDENTVTLTLRDVGTVLAAAVEKVQPSLARQLEQDDRVTVVREEAGGIDAALVSGARLLRTLSVVLGLLWLALTAAALWVARDRRRAAVELGFGAAIGGVAIVLLCVLARAALAARATSVDSDAVKAVFDAFAGDLRTAGWVLAGCGAVVAAAGRSVLKPVELRDPLRRAAAWAEPRADRAALAGRARGRAGGRRRDRADGARCRRRIARRGRRDRARLLRRDRLARADLRPGGRGPGARAPLAAPARAGRAGGGARRGRGRRVRRHRRRVDRRAAHRQVQRARGAVRPVAAGGRARRDTQLHVGAAAGLVLLRAGRRASPSSSTTASAGS